jgi:pyridoxal phosphate enzyme (YggS family)
MTSAPADRERDLAVAWGRLQDRIHDAVQRAGREATEVTTIGVTKTRPAGDARILHGLGVHDLGESRVQELTAKAAELADLTDLRWHFVGQLQRNKANEVVRVAAMVHSVDRPSLARALNTSAERLRPTRLPVCLQISLDGDPSRGGVPMADLPALIDAVAALEGLQLAGVMAVALRGLDPAESFALLAAAAATVRTAVPTATVISAGMSGDFEQAIMHGATHLRIGSLLLGDRAPTP